jgi:hypothetical protein
VAELKLKGRLGSIGAWFRRFGIANDFQSHIVALAGGPKDHYFFGQAVAKQILLLLQIESRLEVEPKALSGAEVPGKP